MMGHFASNHAEATNLEHLRSSVVNLAPNEEATKEWTVAINLKVFRRLTFFRLLETECPPIVMFMPRSVCITLLALPGVRVTVSMVLGVDEITFTVIDPRVLNPVLGDGWWWRERADPHARMLRSFVMFGKKRVKTPDNDETGKPIFRNSNGTFVFHHSITTHSFKGKSYDDHRLQMSFKRTRAHLLPALAFFTEAELA